MNPRLTFSPSDGSAIIENHRLRLAKGLAQREAASALSALQRMAYDFGNGIESLSFHGVSFGEQPCGFALLFRQASLVEVHFSVMLPGAQMQDGWPTKAAIDAELAFVRKELGSQLKASIGERESKFPWGVAWSVFDPKGFQASSGVRYAA